LQPGHLDGRSFSGTGANRWPNEGSLNGSADLLYCTLVYAAAAAKYQQLNGLAGVDLEILEFVERNLSALQSPIVYARRNSNSTATIER
jgi:hypothetical protein